MKKILVVDDEEIIRFALVNILQELGHQTIEAADGYEAVVTAQETQPDLIVMDISMPQMDGIEATKELRKNDLTKHIPVFIATAEENIKHVFNEKDGSRVDGFINKPYQMKILAQQLDEFLKNERTTV